MLALQKKKKRIEEIKTINFKILRSCYLMCLCNAMQLPVGTNNAELEERIIQHLAAAASMGRAHHNGRREGQRSRSSARGHPHFSVFSTHPSASPLGPVSAPGGDSEPAEITVASPSTPLASDGDESSRRSAQFPSVQTDGISPSASGSVRMHRNRQGLSPSHW